MNDSALKKYLSRNSEVISYLIFGALTTILSLIIYWLLVTFILDSAIAIQLQIANVISWIVGVVFAYHTNKKFVFKSSEKNFSPCIKFIGGRIFTLFVDMFIMFVFVSLLSFNDFVIKIISQIVIIVLNYIISKFIVFNNKKNKSFKFGLKNFTMSIVYVIALFIFITLSYLSFKYSATFDVDLFNFNETVVYLNDNLYNMIKYILIFLTFICFYAYLSAKISEKKILYVVIILFSLSSFLWIAYINPTPRADQLKLIDISREFENHDFTSLETNGYLDRYPFQIGTVLVLELIYRIFGDSQVVVFQVCNVLAATGTIYIIYRITNFLFHNEKINKIYLLLSLLCYPLIIFTTFVYGNICGLFFAILAVYLAMLYGKKEKKYLYMFFSTISIIIAILFKKNFIIFLVAIIIYYLFLLVFSHKSETSKWRFNWRLLIGIVCTLISFNIINSLPSQIMYYRSGISLSDGIPMYSYFYMGMEDNEIRAPGWYTASTLETYSEAEFDTDVAKEISKENIVNRVIYFKNNPTYAFEFYQYKYMSTWLHPDFQTIWANLSTDEDFVNRIENNNTLNSILYGDIKDNLLDFGNVYQSLIYIMVLIYFLTTFNKKSIHNILLIIIFIGGVLYHLISETKGFYVVIFFVLLLPYASYSIYTVYNYLIKLFKKIKSKIISNSSSSR